MQEAGFDIIQVYSRTATSASSLGCRLGCEWTDRLEAVRDDGDLYVFAVRDDALPEVIGGMRPNGGTWIHTSGCMPMEVFAGATEQYGVIYPLQTFSKGRTISFASIPLFIEGCSEATSAALRAVAERLSSEVHDLSSAQRRRLHPAAVFACNFTNRMYAVAFRLLEEQGLDGRLLLPLIDETAAKVHALHPTAAQTGPMVRGDVKVMEDHLSMLADETVREIYKAVSGMR